MSAHIIRLGPLGEEPITFRDCAGGSGLEEFVRVTVDVPRNATAAQLGEAFDAFVDAYQECDSETSEDTRSDLQRMLNAGVPVVFSDYDENGKRK